MRTESGFVKFGNANLYYEIAGTGPPLVLIHAGVADSRQWNNEFIHFSEMYRVLRYDMRGYGKSLPVEGEFSHMGDLVALIEALHIDQPLVLIGCSMGGGLALDFTLAYPWRVRALVMLGSGPSGLDLDVPGHPKEADAEAAYKAGDLDLLAELEAQIWFDGMHRTPQQVDQNMRRLALEMNRVALTYEARRLGVRLPDTEIKAVDRLGELNIPMLLVVGDNDVPYLSAATDYMVDHLPSASKVVIEDAAHLANMDHPGRFQRAVDTFLDSIPRK